MIGVLRELVVVNCFQFCNFESIKTALDHFVLYCKGL